MKTNIFSLKKITAVVIAFLMMILSVSYSDVQTDAANTDRDYRIFNSKTFEALGEYTLKKVDSVYNNRDVIGTDDRVIDWTKSGVVKIITARGSFGTGFVVSDHVIATAAHCVEEKLDKILLFDNNGKVTMEATPVQTHVPCIHQGNGSAVYDYALVTVKEDVSSYACFGFGVPLDSFPDSNPRLTITGFPTKFGEPGSEVIVNTATKHMMYSGNGRLLSQGSDRMYYDTDATDGNSGSPVYITESAYGHTYFTVVSIFAHQDNTGNPRNNGVRVTTDLIHFYSANNENIKWE